MNGCGGKKRSKAMMYRQGDVLLVRVDSLPSNLEEIPRDRGRVVLAYGEVTNHAHAIKKPSVRFLRDQESADRFLDVPEPAKLEHEEHATVDVPPGKYRVVQQVEYRPDVNTRSAVGLFGGIPVMD